MDGVPADARLRITASGKITRYVSYAEGLLKDADDARVLVIGDGKSINKAITVTEIVRRKYPHAHQIVSLSCVSHCENNVQADKTVRDVTPSGLPATCV